MDQHDAEQQFSMCSDAVERLDKALYALYELSAHDVAIANTPVIDLDRTLAMLSAARNYQSALTGAAATTLNALYLRVLEQDSVEAHWSVAGAGGSIWLVTPSRPAMSMAAKAR